MGNPNVWIWFGVFNFHFNLHSVIVFNRWYHKHEYWEENPPKCSIWKCLAGQLKFVINKREIELDLRASNDVSQIAWFYYGRTCNCTNIPLKRQIKHSSIKQKKMCFPNNMCFHLAYWAHKSFSFIPDIILQNKYGTWKVTVLSD